MDKQINIKELLDWYIWAGVDTTCSDDACLSVNTEPKPDTNIINSTQQSVSQNFANKQPISNILKNAKDVCASAQSLDELKDLLCHFDGCSLKNTAASTVFGDGCPTAKVMLIGEAPGADEDATGTPFVGRAGKYLTQLMQETGFDRKKDFYICNTVKCRPPENREPAIEEREACSKYLEAQINIVRPKLVVLCGSVAAKEFLGKDIKITQVRGKRFNIAGKIPATVILHPSYLLRNHSEEPNSPRWLTKQDLKDIKKFIEN